MEEERQSKELTSPAKPVHNHTAVSTAQPRLVPLRMAIYICIITTVVTALLVAAGVGGIFLWRTRTNSTNIDKQRQVVVQEGDVIANIAQTVGPSVVSIVAKGQETNPNLRSLLQGNASQAAAGTGIIIDANGLILTNKHVVPTGTSSVQVVLSDGTTYNNATIVGRDPLNDLAILKITNPKKLTAAKIGDSDKVRTGQKVIAIGNALGQFHNTITSGIISGIGRPLQAGESDGSATEQLTNLFQTDAAINPGNSGGPLVNFQGEVIGMNTAIAQDAQNIGFSIPINEAKGIIDSVESTGKVIRPFLGVHYISITPDVAEQMNLSVKTGAYISTDDGAIVADSPAAKAGLKGGDIITKVNDIALDDHTDLSSAVGRFKVGDTINLSVLRAGKQQQFQVKLQAAPIE